ncbi:MAG: hypothetical protein A3F46_07765 [Legionellales bacterium RIFCSPHIGHO2_12_FULL_42_9]|nr:MAG: hypothetical protein A3F46_07765 [Legionellales bacterium RIFCSPHIGHO2_12_FULL_42_9]
MIESSFINIILNFYFKKRNDYADNYVRMDVRFRICINYNQNENCLAILNVIDYNASQLD